MAEGTVPICLLVLSGLPGSGKTTLCQKLKDHFKQKTNMKCLCIHVCYDELLPQDIERNLLSDSVENEESKWKIYRSCISQCVKQLILNLRASNSQLHLSDPEYVISCHGDAKSQTHTIPSSLELKHSVKPEGVADDLWERFHQCVGSQIGEENASHVNSVVVLIDDNMFYRSMRYTYYQMAREYQLGFCQICLNCSVEMAVQNNELREVQIPQNIIFGMEQRLEPPDPQKNMWESLSLNVSKSTDLWEIEELILKALATPVLPVISAEDKEEQEKSRQICLQNFTHQADQLLRKLIGQQMKQLTEQQHFSKNVKKTYGADLNSVRTEILEDIKHRKFPITISNDCSEQIKDSKSILYKKIEELFSFKTKDIKPIV